MFQNAAEKQLFPAAHPFFLETAIIRQRFGGILGDLYPPRC